MSVMLNAVVQSAWVGYGGYQDRMLGLYVTVKFEGSGCLMVEGHYSLCLPESFKHFKEGTPLGLVIMRWLEATGVRKVEDMVGKPIRVESAREWCNYEDVIRIGHIIESDKWFSTREICKAWEARLEASK
jgi:hypothetical protein